MKKDLQNTTRNISGDLIEIKNGYPDAISFWIEAYFRFEATTSANSQKVRRQLDRTNTTPAVYPDLGQGARQCLKG